jgi:ABC-2 type transport system ATP-binding protein
LALGIAIVHQPRLLFLDEPTSGVDPLARRSFWDLIYQLVEQGVTALVTTHYMDEAEYCGRVGIMRDGRLMALDSPSALRRDALPGRTWDIYVDQSAEQEPISSLLLPALSALQNCPCVLRAGLVSDHLRAITPKDVSLETLQGNLEQEGIGLLEIVATEPTLEDIFLALAARD